MITVVFDLDGTLVDSAPDLVDTLNTIFAREGMPPVPYEEARLMVGGGARAMIQKGLRAENRGEENADRLLRDFIAYYAEHIADRSRPFPGVEEVLEKLSAAGCRLAVCTNKLEWLSLRLLDALGLRQRFAAICGGDTFGVGKPDARVLRGTIARAGGGQMAVLVGDSATDIATARNAQLPIVAVSFGYSDPPVGQFGPDRLIHHFDELPEAVFELVGSPAFHGTSA